MLILHKKKLIRTTLSFNKVVNGAGEILSMEYAGINMGRPGKVTQDQFDRVMQEYGLFGGSSDNNKFYKDLELDDIMPKPSDFINVPMRFISATIVGGGSWKATDFSQPGVLRAATEKINGKPLFTEHDQEVLNNVGMAVDAYWEEPTGSGEDYVPGGIAGTAMVDYKTNPKLARSLLTGAIYSSSVTTTFDWEASHKFNTLDEFNMAAGSFGKDGQMVRRVVSEVYDIDESSFVWLGADPFAKTKGKDGKLRNVDKKAVYFQKMMDNDSLSFDKADQTETEQYKSEKKLHIGFGIPKTILSLSKERVSKVTLPDQPDKTTKSMNKFLLAFIATFGKDLNLSFTADENTELTDEQTAELENGLAKLGLKVPGGEQAANFVKGLKVVKEAGEFEAAELSKLSLNKKEMVVMTVDEFTQLNAKATTALSAEETQSLTKRAELGDTYMNFKRGECERLYKKAVQTPDDTVLNLIKTGAPDVVEGLLKTYADKAVQSYSATCTKCNSAEHVTMRSSFETALPGEPGGTTKAAFTPDVFRQRADEGNGLILGRSRK